MATEIVNLPPYDQEQRDKMSKIMKDKYANGEVNIS